MKFFNTLAGFANIDQETYRCELIVMTRPLYSLPDLNSRPLGERAHEDNMGGLEGVCLLVAAHISQDPRAAGPHQHTIKCNHIIMSLGLLK